MRISAFPFIAAIIAAATPPDYDKPKRKGFTGDLAFLNPMNQPFTYMHQGYKGCDAHSRINQFSRRTASMRRTKIVH